MAGSHIPERRIGMERYYVAYGSNLNKRQMSSRCPSAEAIGTADIRGWRLLYRRTYLTIEPKQGCHVPVGIWKVTESDERNLDRYEGYPRFYIKRDFNLEVAKTDGTKEKLPCFAYVMAPGYPVEMPSRYYVDTVEWGYVDFGLDRRILRLALQDTMRELPQKKPLWKEAMELQMKGKLR